MKLNKNIFCAILLGIGTIYVAKILQAHDLNTIIFVSPPNPIEDFMGPQGVPVEIPVDLHFHECIPKEVEVFTPLGIILKIFHKKKFTVADSIAVSARSTDLAASSEGNVIFASPPNNVVNCHGFTFDNGISWLEDPIPFLRHCMELPPPPPNLPDNTVVVYWNQGRIMHSGRVIPTPPGKTGVWVHSQWGNLGDFKHNEFWVPPEYGVPKYYSCRP